jgi:outer membrane lipoprotein-sorting protein
MRRSTRLFVTLATLALAACAAQLPPPARVGGGQALVGTYSGSMKEYGTTPRPARVTIKPDSTFEITTGGPEGARTTGMLALRGDGAIVYETGQTRGVATVYEGDARRVIVFQRDDGTTTATVERGLP